MKRRWFLQSTVGLTLTTLPSLSQSFPLTKMLGAPSREYTYHYLKRFWSWYNKVWFAFDEQMTSDEKKLFSGWMARKPHFGTSWEDNVFFENFLVRHRISDKEQNHGRLYLGLPQWPDELIKLYQKVLLSRHHSPAIPNLPWTHFFGFCRDFDLKKDKLFFRTKDLQAMKAWVGFEPQITPTPNSLTFIEFSGGKEHRRGWVIPIQQIPEKGHSPLPGETILNGFFVIDNKGGQSWKIRTRSTFLPFLPKGAMSLAGRHKQEFNQLPDFLDVSKKGEGNLYYP